MLVGCVEEEDVLLLLVCAAAEVDDDEEDSHCSRRTMDGSDFAPSMNSSNDNRPSEFLSICLNIFSVLRSGVDSSSGIFIVVPIILYMACLMCARANQIERQTNNNNNTRSIHHGSHVCVRVDVVVVVVNVKCRLLSG